ncbi:hypothetical protein QUW15_13490, partial [Desulfovibrio piger]|nr:hypothetical protein [Desulfovibrio piger]
MKKEKREAAQRRPARSEGKDSAFSRSDRPHGLRRAAFQTENAPGRSNLIFFLFILTEYKMQTAMPLKCARHMACVFSEKARWGKDG